ncbi:FAD-dependent thymidylate synthase [bacterium]|nr:FAD-dependent thymidylate synthase [bacterium]
MPEETAVECFSADERRALEPYFTTLDGPVFALRNLPEVVKAALFARYSRSPKSLRRLFLDEFLDRAGGGLGESAVGVRRSEQLFQRVLAEYGDDSVAQLGGAHLAVEGASNLLTKALEWGRLMAYLEQSTRYIPYTQRADGRWRYVVPDELAGSPLRDRYVALLDRCFETYAGALPAAIALCEQRLPRPEGVGAAAHAATVRAQALDALRGLLPAATRSNVGIFGSGQGYESLLLHLRAHPLAEARACAEAIRRELEQVIPAFLSRVDRPDRGGAWTAYLRDTREATAALASELLGETAAAPAEMVTLTDFDPDGEVKVVAAALYAATSLPDAQLLAAARSLSEAQRAALLRAYVGERRNRRHKPGRAFERAVYRFDVVADYGAFRDLQRHRLCTLEWQRLTPALGYVLPEIVEAIGAAPAWRALMAEAAELHAAIAAAGLPDVAAYVLPMAHRVRFYLECNAREAMHLIELRSTPQGHPAYRVVAQAMHRLIAERAGHRAIAAAMRFVDHSPASSGRLEAERRSRGS